MEDRSSSEWNSLPSGCLLSRLCCPSQFLVVLATQLLRLEKLVPFFTLSCLTPHAHIHTSWSAVNSASETLSSSGHTASALFTCISSPIRMRCYVSPFIYSFLCVHLSYYRANHLTSMLCPDPSVAFHGPQNKPFLLTTEEVHHISPSA